MKKKRILSLLMALTLFISLLPHAAAVSARDFTDVSEDDWCFEYVDYVTSQGYFLGTTDTTFSPNRSMTRAMFVVVLSRYDGARVNNSQSAFTDVEPGAWCAGAINWAAANGIVGGYEDGTFRPDQPVTRAQMCAIMDRYVEYYCDEHDVTVAAKGSVSTLADQAQIPSYAVGSVRDCQRWGLINGYADGTFRPQAESSRAHVAAVIYRLAFLLDDAEPNKPDRPSHSGGGSSGGSDDPSYTYRLTYDANGGKFSNGETSVTDVKSSSSSRSCRFTVTYMVPARDGYTFQGWATSSTAASAEYTSGQTYTVDSDRADTLYAVWTQDTDPNDLIGNAVEKTVNAFNSKFTQLKLEVINAVYDVNQEGGYFTNEELLEIANAIQSMASVSNVSYDKNANPRTVTADVTLNVTEGQVIDVIDKASDFASQVIEGGTSSLPSADKLDDFLAEVKDRVQEITGIELTNQTLAEIRQQVIEKVIGEGKEMWANFHDGKGNYVTGDVTIATADGDYSVTVKVANGSTTLDGVSKTEAVKQMGLALAKDMLAQLKEQSAGEYISNADVSGDVVVTFTPSANAEIAAQTDQVPEGYVYNVSLNATADSDGMVSYKFDDSTNYVKLFISQDIQDAYNEALVAAAGDITEDSGAKDKVVEKVRAELSTRAADIYADLVAKLESYGIELETVTAGDLVAALTPVVPAWVDINWGKIVAAAADEDGTLADMDNTALVDAAWNVMKVEIPQTPDEMDAMIQDLIVDQLEKNGIDDSWLVEAANKNELVQQVSSLGETMSLTFYDADDNVIDMDLNFESAADINQLLTVFRVNAGGLFDVTGARDENNQPTAFGGAVRTTIIEEAQDELIAKMNESETIKDLIGDNEDLQNYLLYSALVSLDLDFDAEKEEAYQGGAVLADLDISSIAKKKMTELLEDELAQVSVKDYLDEDDSYQDKIDLLNSLKFPNVTEQTFAGLAEKLRGKTVADLIGSRGDSYVEKYLGRIVDALMRNVPDGASVTVNGVELDKTDLAAFEDADTTLEAVRALADVLDDFGTLRIDDCAEPGIPVTVQYNSRTFNFNFVIEVE